ncbi:MAG TPA: hypothetical protein VK081_00725, partial [Planctomycetota bacterium]|nr:hypothetical protein [Planctomycetota bacterium]
QPTKAFFQETLGVDSNRATGIVTALSLLGCFFVLWFSGDGVALNTIDAWVGTFLIVVLAAVQVICFAWVFGLQRGMREMLRGAQLRVPGLFRFVYLFIAPTYLLITIGSFAWNDLPSWLREAFDNRVAGLALLLVLGVLALLIACTAIGEKRWRAQGLDLDGREPLPDDDPEPARAPAEVL